jgi:hypothetical protein
VAWDEIDPKIVTGLNLNLEEQTLPAGKQCMGMLCHSHKTVTQNSIIFVVSTFPHIVCQLAVLVLPSLSSDLLQFLDQSHPMPLVLKVSHSK